MSNTTKSLAAALASRRLLGYATGIRETPVAADGAKTVTVKSGTVKQGALKLGAIKLGIVKVGIVKGGLAKQGARTS